MTTTTNILLFDNDSTKRQALGQALAADNCRVVPAAGDQETLRESGPRSIAIVFPDARRRSEPGWEPLPRPTALASHTPVIGMTARFKQQHPSSIAHGFDARMESLNLAVLIHTIKELSPQSPEPRRRCCSPSTTPRI